MTGNEGGNPFVGPRPIQFGESLHGRDVAVRELYNRIRARRIVVVHSPSGAGKSSLIQAGLMPRLQEGGFEVCKAIRVNLDPRGLEGVRPGSANRYLLSAVISLEEGLAPEGERLAPAELAGMDLRAYLERRLPAGRGARPPVLIFDQFEEVLTVEPRAVEDKRQFFRALGQLLEDERYWALFALREDYLAAFAPYRELLPTRMSHTFRLDLLDRDSARRAAVRLAQEGTPSRAFPAVDQLVRDLSMVRTQGPDGEPLAEEGLYVEPVYLQVVCRQLWAKMPADDVSIDPQDIEAYADVSAVLGAYYADAVQSAAPGDLAAERSVREWVRARLIPGGIRSQVRRGPADSAGLPNHLVDGLVSSYIVRAEQRAGATWLELSHDRLVEPIERNNADWERSHLHSAQVQARLWEAGGRSRVLLLAAEALPGAQAAHRENDALWTKADREFLAESRQLRDEEARRRRTLRATAAVLGVALVAALGAVAFATWQFKVAKRAEGRANQASDEAHDAKIAAYEEQGRAAALDGRTGHALAYLSAVYTEGFRDKRSLWMTQFLLAGLARELDVPQLQDAGKKVWSMVFSPGGARIAAIDGEGRVRVWDARSGHLLATLEGTGAPIRAIAFAGTDGGRVLAGDQKGGVRLFAVEGGRPPCELETGKKPVTALAWSPNSGAVAIGYGDGDVQLRALEDGHFKPDGGVSGGEPQVRCRFKRGPTVAGERLATDVRALAFSADGKMLAAGSWDAVLVWNTRSGAVTASRDLTTSFGAIDALAISPDGKRFAVGTHDDFGLRGNFGVYLIPVVNNYRDYPKLAVHPAPIRAIAFSSDGHEVVMGAEDGAVLRSNLSGAHPEALVPSRLGAHDGAVLAVASGRDPMTGAETIATAALDGTSRLWVPARLRAGYNGRDDSIHGVVFSADGTLTTVTIDGQTLLFPASPGPLKWEPKVGRTGFSINWPDTVAAISGDGKTAVSLRDHDSVYVWRAGAPAALFFTAKEEPSSHSYEDRFCAVALSRDGSTIAVSAIDRKIVLGQAKNPEAKTVLEVPSSLICRGMMMAFSPDGKLVAAAGENGVACLWQVSDGARLPDLKGHTATIRSVAFSLDGATAATAGDDGSVVLSDVKGGRTLARWPAHTKPITAVAFSPPVPSIGPLVATASEDGTAQVWLPDGRRLAVVRGHSGSVRGLAFSPDGNSLVTFGEDGTLRLWDLRVEQRPPAEIAREMACRIPWKMGEKGTLVPVPLNPSRCAAKDPARPVTSTLVK